MQLKLVVSQPLQIARRCCTNCQEYEFELHDEKVDSVAGKRLSRGDDQLGGGPDTMQESHRTQSAPGETRQEYARSELRRNEAKRPDKQSLGKTSVAIQRGTKERKWAKKTRLKKIRSDFGSKHRLATKEAGHTTCS